MVNTLHAAGLLAYLLVYTTVIALSRYLAVGPESGPPLFLPATGLLFATFLVIKPKDWWIFAGLGLIASLLGNWIVDVPLNPHIFVLYPFRVAVMFAGAMLLRHFAKPYTEYSPQQALLFVGIAGILTPLLSSIITSYWYAFANDRSFMDSFRTHFAGMSLGLLTFTPFVLAIYSLYVDRNRPIDWRSLSVDISILLATFFVSLQIFVYEYLPRSIHWELLVVPVLIAISFRGSSPLTATANLMISIFAFYRVVEEKDFFNSMQLQNVALNNVQFFVGITTLTHLLLTAAVRRRMAVAESLSEKTSELERVNIDLDRATQTAMAASEAKSYFLANMSHEIRSPLGAIIGYADLIANSPEDLEENSKFATIISRNGHHLLELVNQILDLSKIEAGQFEVLNEQIKLRHLVDDVAEVMGRKAQEKGLSFTVEWSDGVPDIIQTDDLRLKQILINGLGNAIKFTERGKVLLRISCPLNKDGHYRPRFEIEDTGIGLDGEEQGKLFQAFQQASRDIHRKYGGTGLGLELSRRLARLMGGDYTLVHSVKGVGSIFLLEVEGGLPLPKLNDSLTQLEPLPQALKEARQLNGLNVLLVDDAADNRFLITRFLQLSGATVDSAENGRKALERIEEEEFDIVLMDIEMPEMNGLEATRRLRSMHYEGPVLALTGRAMPAEIDECLEAGFDGHLVKPINRDLLINSIAEWTKVRDIDLPHSSCYLP